MTRWTLPFSLAFLAMPACAGRARAHLAAGERTRALRRGRMALEIHRKLPKLAEDVAEVEAFVEGLR